MIKKRNYTYSYIGRLRTALSVASVAAVAATVTLAVLNTRLLPIMATSALAAFLILANLLIEKLVGDRILNQIDKSLQQLAAGSAVGVTPQQIKRHPMFRRIGGVAKHYNELIVHFPDRYNQNHKTKNTLPGLLLLSHRALNRFAAVWLKSECPFASVIFMFPEIPDIIIFSYCEFKLYRLNFFAQIKITFII